MGEGEVIGEGGVMERGGSAGEGRECWRVMEGGKGEWWRVMEGRGRGGGQC